MSHIVAILPLLVVVAFQDGAHPTPAVKQSYEAAKVAAGTNPSKLIKLSLWCEAHGLRDEQRAVLEEAVRLDPNNQTAHGLLGQVSYQRRLGNPRGGEPAGEKR